MQQSIISWSHSRAVDFEQCRLRAKLKYLDRIPEPERPLPPGKTEHANDRGTRVHNALEDYVCGKIDTQPREARTFADEVDKMRQLFDVGRVSLEGEWGYDRGWEPCDYRSAWLRVKLDALVFLNEHEVVAIDYKTGRKFGNEIKHGEQLQLYQLATFLRYPEVEVVHTELWYLDQDDLTRKTFMRPQGLRFKANWERRGNDITTALEFPPNPNMWSCKYCPYGKPENGFPDGSGHCSAGRRR